MTSQGPEWGSAATVSAPTPVLLYRTTQLQLRALLMSHSKTTLLCDVTTVFWVQRKDPPQQQHVLPLLF